MPNVESFWRGELRSAISASQTVPFTLNVSNVPNNENMYFTVDGDTDNEEIFYFTTKTGTVGSTGTLNVTGRGYNKHNSSQSSTNYKPHAINATYNGSINHIVINQKAGLNEENIFTEVVIPPTFADDAAADASYTGGVAPNGSLFYSTAAGAVRVKQGGAWANSTGSADFGATRNISGASASNGESFRDTGSSNDWAIKDHGGIVRNILINATGKFDTNRLEFASQAEAQAGSDNSKLITSLRTKEAIDSQREFATSAEWAAGASSTKVLSPSTAGASMIVPTSRNPYFLVAQANTRKNHFTASFVKQKEVVAPVTGTYSVTFSIDTGGGGLEVQGRIYKNGSAFGTLRFNTSSGTYTESLAFTAGDLIQLYTQTTNVAQPVHTENFYVQASYVPVALVGTVNLD